MDDFKVEGKVPVVMERFTIERTVGERSLILWCTTSRWLKKTVTHL